MRHPDQLRIPDYMKGGKKLIGDTNKTTVRDQGGRIITGEKGENKMNRSYSVRGREMNA